MITVTAKLRSNGDYKASELAAASEGKRITADIIKEVVQTSKNRWRAYIRQHDQAL